MDMHNDILVESLQYEYDPSPEIVMSEKLRATAQSIISKSGAARVQGDKVPIFSESKEALRKFSWKDYEAQIMNYASITAQTSDESKVALFRAQLSPDIKN